MIDFQHPFTVTGFQAIQLRTKNWVDLQALLERCADYSLLVSGSTPSPSAAASLLEDRPEGKAPADKLVLGFSTQEGDLAGVLDAVRDYPARNDWWLGLLLIDPAERNKGLGREIYGSFEAWVRLHGAMRIYLGVVEENRRAYRFWQSIGFHPIERQPARQFGNHSHAVITMLRNLEEGINDRD